jgi:hypothetical protein
MKMFLLSSVFLFLIVILIVIITEPAPKVYTDFYIYYNSGPIIIITSLILLIIFNLFVYLIYRFINSKKNV